VTGTTGTDYPVRQKSARGEPRPQTSIERCCQSCRASFIGLAPGKTGEAGIWHNWRWYCSAECAPAACRPAGLMEHIPEEARQP
jgi:hypothetical protein